MLTTKEIMNRLTTDLTADECYSAETLKAEQLYFEFEQELDKTLDQEQKELCLQMSNVKTACDSGFWRDGVAYGFLMAQRLREALEKPEKTYAEITESAEVDMLYDEKMFLEKFKNRSGREIAEGDIRKWGLQQIK